MGTYNLPSFLEVRKSIFWGLKSLHFFHGFWGPSGYIHGSLLGGSSPVTCLKSAIQQGVSKNCSTFQGLQKSLVHWVDLSYEHSYEGKPFLTFTNLPRNFTNRFPERMAFWKLSQVLNKDGLIWVSIVKCQEGVIHLGGIKECKSMVTFRDLSLLFASRWRLVIWWPLNTPRKGTSTCLEVQKAWLK